MDSIIKDSLIAFLDDLYNAETNNYDDEKLHDKLKSKVFVSKNPLSLLAPLSNLELQKEVLVKNLSLFNGKLRGKSVIPKDSEEFDIILRHLTLLKTFTSIEDTDTLSTLLNSVASANSNNNSIEEIVEGEEEIASTSATKNEPLSKTIDTVGRYINSKKDTLDVQKLTSECMSLLPQLMSADKSKLDLNSFLQNSQLGSIVNDIMQNTDVVNQLTKNG